MSKIEYIHNIQFFLHYYFSIESWQDICEIIFFITTSYKVINWLKKDHTHALLHSLYSYFTLLSISYLTHCFILFQTLLFASPILILLAIIFHQKQLQKNYILSSNKPFTPTTIPHKNWPEILIRSALLVSHQNKSTICIIEQSDAIHTLIDTPFSLELPIQLEITNLLLTSSHFEHNNFLWISPSGIIKSLNCSFHQNIKDEHSLFATRVNNTFNPDQALYFTKKTDALIFKINAQQHMHTLWYKGICTNQLTIDQLLQFIKNITFNYYKENDLILKKEQNNDYKETTL